MAILCDEVRVYRMPDTIAAVAGIIQPEKGPLHVFVEKCQSLPGNAARSMFNYGVHFGELLGMLQILVIPHTLVPPATWARVMHAGCKAGAPKARSLEAVRRLFPSVNLVQPRCKKPHDGCVDALLIAEYGRRVLKA